MTKLLTILSFVIAANFSIANDELNPKQPTMIIAKEKVSVDKKGKETKVTELFELEVKAFDVKNSSKKELDAFLSKNMKKAKKITKLKNFVDEEKMEDAISELNASDSDSSFYCYGYRNNYYNYYGYRFNYSRVYYPRYNVRYNYGYNYNFRFYVRW